MKNLENEILNICNYDYKFFLNKPNVVGVGLGFKIRNNITTCEKVIQVFVEKKLSSNQLNPRDLIPSSYKKIKTDVLESGLFYSTGLTQRIRPVFGGYSCAPAGFLIAGTYGGLVTDGNSFFMLGNNHVFALNQLPLNHPILQPGPSDGGSSPGDIVARLSKFIPLQISTTTSSPENFVDCAIAEIVSPNIASSEIAFIGKPKGITAATLNLPVQMACRTSEYLTGPIHSMGVTLTINNPILGGDILFKNQILVNYGVKDGDSGSLVLTFDYKVVGLQMGGNDNFCICNPIDAVLNALNVTLVT